MSTSGHGSEGSACINLLLPAQSMTCYKQFRKTKAPNFLYKKGPKGSSEGGLRHLMTPWRSKFKMPLYDEARSLGKVPFCLKASISNLPNKKNSTFSSFRGVVWVVHQRPQCVRALWGWEPDEHPTWDEKTKAFSNRNNLSQFCRLQLQRYKLYYFVCLRKGKTFFLSNTDPCQQQAKFWPYWIN